MAVTVKKERKKLSKHLLEMKFMKCSRDRILQEKEEEDCRFMFYSNISDELKSSTSKYIMENSFAVCEGLKCGRRSYKGMNTTIEKIIESENDDKSFIPKIKEEDVDVSAEDMFKFQREKSTLVETIKRKFDKAESQKPKYLSKISAKKAKFMKPVDD